jgi:hypothetical protein
MVRIQVRILAVAISVAIGGLLLEGISALGLFWIDGKRFSYARLDRERSALQEFVRPAPLNPRATPPVVVGPAAAGRPETTPSLLVVHPFMGFTQDPRDPKVIASIGHGGMKLDEHGFFNTKPSLAGATRVGVFGGSVSVYACLDGREALVASLKKNPILHDKVIDVRCYGLGGFKQPQPLAALAYLLSLGEHFDAVVELDGFNELALSFNASKFKGAFPAYPTNWDLIVSSAADRTRQRRIGRVVSLEEARATFARGFGRKPLRWSITASLIWRCLDRRLERQLGSAREELNRAAASSNYEALGISRNYADDDARLQDIASQWANASRAMAHLCKGAGIRYAHFLQPNQYVPGSKPMSAAERAVSYRTDHPFRYPVENGYPLLQSEGRHLAAEGVPFHDLSRIFAGVQEPLYRDDCCHLSEKGSVALGAEIGRVLSATW